MRRAWLCHDALRSEEHEKRKWYEELWNEWSETKKKKMTMKKKEGEQEGQKEDRQRRKPKRNAS